MENDLFLWIKEFIFTSFNNISNLVNSWFPQLTDIFSNLPFVGEFLGNISNFELTIILLLITAVFYAKKTEFIIKWFTVAVVVFIILLLFGVINL